MVKKLIITVDLDMWYHCPWATGGSKAIWKEVPEAIAHYYGVNDSRSPPDDFPTLTAQILDLFDEYNIKGTFFILGEMAQTYPQVVKAVCGKGHEIASHGLRHISASLLTDRQLSDSMVESKKIIEDISGTQVRGFRFPNLIIPLPVFRVLSETGYEYDSSICFSRSIQGKFGYPSPSIYQPYHPNLEKPFLQGDTNFWEFPIPVFPFLKLPAATGIATRIFGKHWTAFALKSNLRKTGVTQYYFHPYELGSYHRLASQSWYVRLFMRRSGDRFSAMLRALLKSFSSMASFTSIRDWIYETSGAGK